jgi:2-hydroxy-3-keto-5-methylthiopentenyl-1-phosphate phosphatase
MMNRAVLVSDFDGTMTRNDFYKLAVETLIPPDMPPYWQEYRSGRKTHFEALQAIFATIRADEATVLDVVRRMEIDPELMSAVDELDRSGWSVVVASAGCEWYIRRLLAGLEGRVEVHSNPGRFEAGRGLLMELPTRSPYYCGKIGIDKAAIVRKAIEAGRTVAFAGDGFPDLDAALLVPPERRFARGDLADSLRELGSAFHPFGKWSEIARALTPTAQPS